MNTLVYQSYRTSGVPSWISRCLDSVRNWSREHGYQYRFVDDALFGYAPSWYREKVDHNIQLVSDLSRLVLARNFLQEEFQRVIWIDADVLVFDPVNFKLETTSGVSFCREVWIDEDSQGRIVHQEKINNSVSIFHRDNALLEFYIDACLRLVEQAERTPAVLVGTSFLTDLNKIYPLQQIQNVGILSRALGYDLISRGSGFLEKYLKWQGSPVQAINLCGSMKDQVFRGVRIDHAATERIVNNLMQRKALQGPEKV